MWSRHDMRITWVFGILCIICKIILFCFHHITLYKIVEWLDEKVMGGRWVGSELIECILFWKYYLQVKKNLSGTSLINLHFILGFWIAHSGYFTMCLVLKSLNIFWKCSLYLEIVTSPNNYILVFSNKVFLFLLGSSKGTNERRKFQKGTTYWCGLHLYGCKPHMLLLLLCNAVS